MTTIQDALAAFVNFINITLVPVLFAVAFIVILYYTYKYFIEGGASPDGQKKGRSYLFGAIIALAIMISIWGIVNLLVDSFGFRGATRPCLPTFGGAANCVSGGNSNNSNTTAFPQPASAPAPSPAQSGSGFNNLAP